jgi:uncharacterized protein (DUF2141 family)
VPVSHVVNRHFFYEFCLTMKVRNLCLLAFWISVIAVGSCARRGVPTGGPKDTVPPTLLNMSPELETVNFDDSEIAIEFDEFIQARSLKQDLIINPPVDDYDFYVNRRSLVIEFNEDLQENTTYTFNFRDAIKDISEQNPAENVIMAFSTGSKIDSFQVRGQIKQLFTGLPAEEALVALYPESDTLSPFEDPPTYLTKTDEEGNYEINYIKIGTYKIFAFIDDNNNLKIDSNNEPLGFESDPVVLIPEETQPQPLDTMNVQDSLSDSRVTLYGKSVDLRLLYQDVRPVTIQSSRSNGKYYEIKTNKSIRDYTLRIDTLDLENSTIQYLDSLQPELPKDTLRYLYSNFQDQQKTIRIYNTLRQDSLRTFITLTDSVNQVAEDTLYVQFLESRREAEELSQTTTAVPEIQDSIKLTISFSKPITQVKTDSILLSYDTLFYLPLNYDSLFRWNKRVDRVELNHKVNKRRIVDTLQQYLKERDSLQFISNQEQKALYLDSLRSAQNLEEQIRYFEPLAGLIRSEALLSIADSINSLEDEDQQSQLLNNLSDTLDIEASHQPQVYLREDLLGNLKPLILYSAAGSFMSIEQDSSQQIIQNYTFKKPEEYGTISGSINTEYESYEIQLLDNNYNVVTTTEREDGEFAFRLVPPGEYKLRVLIDENLNGQWDRGNILQNQEPEPIYFYTEEEAIELRANWEREINLAF